MHLLDAVAPTVWEIIAYSIGVDPETLLAIIAVAAIAIIALLVMKKKK